METKVKNTKNINKKPVSDGWNTFANWLIDVSKYLMTGILLSSVFKDIDNKILFYIISFGLSIIILISGIIIKNNKKEE